MRASTLVALALVAATLGCGGGQVTIGSSVGQAHEGAEPSASASKVAAPAPTATAAAPAGEAKPPETSGAPLEPVEPVEPPPDPALVKALVEKTGEAGATDNALGMRLEIMPRPAGQLWLLAVVNRGTQAAEISFDLRRLTLQLEQPEDPQKPRPKWQKKPAAKVCKLPDRFGGAADADETTYSLEPGEGLVQSFDPRLYCISTNGESMLAQGQVVTAAFGYSPKPPRRVWQRGKLVEVPATQVAPFVAQPVTADPENDRRVKQLLATPFEVSADIAGGEAEEDTSLPLQLRLVRGSDAATERTATATVQVRARGQKAQLYFRRELISFIVHGPEGIRGCDPQPDDRAPDRQAYSTLAPGASISVTSMLAELCPNLTFGRPGLYLVSARLDAIRDGSEFGLRAFTGRLESRRQALVRITSGDLPALPAPEPMRVRVGQ